MSTSYNTLGAKNLGFLIGRNEISPTSAGRPAGGFGFDDGLLVVGARGGGGGGLGGAGGRLVGGFGGGPFGGGGLGAGGGAIVAAAIPSEAFNREISTVLEVIVELCVCCEAIQVAVSQL